MKLHKLVQILDEELDIPKLKDASLNGLQVQGTDEVKKIAFAVDADLSTIKKAANLKANMLIVHHGLFWSRGERITGARKMRIKSLIDNNMSLYAAHLPLDCHRKLGNNVALAKMIGMKITKKFGYQGDEYWGFEGLIKPTTVKNIAKVLAKKLSTSAKVYSFGKEKVRKLGIISGGGMFSVTEAAEKEVDLIITGEPSYSNYHQAKELGINVICAGHYATETLGVQSLAGWVSKHHKIEVVFIENKIPL